MKAFLATLFGDARNCAVVAAAIAGETVMVNIGLSPVAAFAMPAVILAGIAWIASSTR
jgi:hypothetical protein